MNAAKIKFAFWMSYVFSTPGVFLLFLSVFSMEQGYIDRTHELAIWAVSLTLIAIGASFIVLGVVVPVVLQFIHRELLTDAQRNRWEQRPLLRIFLNRPR